MCMPCAANSPSAEASCTVAAPKAAAVRRGRLTVHAAPAAAAVASASRRTRDEPDRPAGPGQRAGPRRPGGPRRPARGIAVARQALYLLPHGQRDPLALVVPGAVRVAAAVVLPGAAGDRPFHGLTPGRTGRVGAGRIAIGSLCLTAGEFWARPRAQDTPPRPGTRPARHAPPAPAAAARGPHRRPCSRAHARARRHRGPAVRGPAVRGPRPARPRPRRDTLRGRLPVRAAARRPGAAAPAGLARGTRTYRGRGGQADAAGLGGPSPAGRRRSVHPSGRGAAAGRRDRWRPVRPGHRPARRRPQFGVRPAARPVRGSAPGDPRPRRGQAPIHTVVMRQNPLMPRSDSSCPDPDRAAPPKGPAAEAGHHPPRTDQGTAVRPRRPRPHSPSHPPAVDRHAARPPISGQSHSMDRPSTRKEAKAAGPDRRRANLGISLQRAESRRPRPGTRRSRSGRGS